MIYMIVIFLIVFIYGNYKFVLFSIRKPNNIKRLDNKIRSLKSWFFTQGVYSFFYKYFPVINKKIIFESHLGEDIGGNPYYILLEILNNKKYSRFDCYVVGDKKRFFRRKI